MRAIRGRSAAARLVLLAAVAAPEPALHGGAEAPGPALRPGLWRFERSFEYADGRVADEAVRSEICLDPEAQARELLAMFRKMGCSAERTRTGVTQWRIEVRCDQPGLPRGRSTSVQTVTGPDAYELRVVNEGEMATPILRERGSARRLGDC